MKNKKLIPVPQGFYLIAPTKLRPFLKTPLFSLPGKARVILEPLVPRRDFDGDESIGAFVRRRFGREALERVGQAMLAGIYAGDPELLSLSATLPRFQELEKKYGSVIKGLIAENRGKDGNLNGVSGPRYGLFLSFKEGMETLTNEIVKRLPSGVARLNSEIKEISYDASQGKWLLILDHGEVQPADVVCSALSAPATGRLLQRAAKEISDDLSRISYESVATLNLAYKREDLSHPLDGFGFVVPRREKSALIGCTFSSQKFDHRAPQGFTLLRAFVGGVFGREYFEREDEDLKSLAQEELTSLLGIKRKAVFTLLRRYPASMVQYKTGHLELVKKIRTALKKWPGLFLAGAAFRGIGIPDCIADAETQAEEMVGSLRGARREKERIG